MRWESRSSEPRRETETREEGDVSPRAIVRVGHFVHDRMKKHEKANGILHRETGKLLEVERQTDGAWSLEDRKVDSVEKQTGWGSAIREMGCRCRLGPTGTGQEGRRDRGRKKGLGVVGGGEPRTIIDQAERPETKQLGPLQFLGPAENISPVQRGLRVSPAKKQASEEQKSCPISPDRMQMK